MAKEKVASGRNGNWRIAGGHVVEPAMGTEGPADVYIRNGLIATPPLPAGEPVRTLDARGLVVCPGFIDLHTHLRDPGNLAAETLSSAAAAAARGGFTTVVAMPNTDPPPDSADRLEAWIRRARTECFIDVLACGCLTVGRAGLQAVDVDAMVTAGAIAFSDDGTTPLDDQVLTEIARHAQRRERPILDHAEDVRCSANGVMHAGEINRRLGLPGIPEESEILAVDRDIRIADATGCAMHIQHVSCARSIAMIREARHRGLPVTAEVTPHHLAFCDRDVDAANAAFKMNPPLRDACDRAALREAVIDGTVGILATDHAPHTAQAKAQGFLKAPFGVVGLETALAVTYTLLVVEAGMPLMHWVRRWTSGPARVLGLSPTRLTPGEPANLVVFDPRVAETVDPSAFLSRSNNSPFIGKRYTGVVCATMAKGNLVWSRPAFTASD